MERVRTRPLKAHIGRKLIKKMKRKPNRSILGDFAIRLIIILISLLMAFPIIFAMSNAFKPLDELFIFPPRLFVRHPTLDNFMDISVYMANSWVPFSRYLFNSLMVTSTGTAGHIILASMAAFVVAKHKFPGGKLFFNVAVLSLLFSPYITTIPNYITMVKIGWVNSYAAIIVPALGYPMGFFLMKQFMDQVPESTLESARIDGSKEFTVFWKIVMPSVKPAWLTLLVFSFQILWNDQGGLFIYNEELKSLPYALQQILLGGIARAGMGAAVAVIIAAVPIVLFVITQSNILQTMSTSGLKD